MALFLAAALRGAAALRPPARRTVFKASFASAAAPERSNPWSSLGLRDDLSALAAANWETPNAVQRNAIRAALARKDVVVGAETGSGKTLAYLLPAAQAAMESKAPRGPTADAPRAGQYPTVLVLVPNRELGTQLVRVAAQLGGDTAAACDAYLRQGAEAGW